MKYQPKHMAPPGTGPSFIRLESETEPFSFLDAHTNTPSGRETALPTSGTELADRLPSEEEHGRHDHTHEVDSAAEERARKVLIGGCVGSLTLAALESKFGISEDLHGLIGNRNHNFGDGAIHAARAIAIGARLAGRNAKSKLFKMGSTYAMAAVTGMSAAHVGEAGWELWTDPSHVLRFETDVLTKEAGLSAASATLNAGIAVGLARGTEGSSVGSEVGLHSKRDKFESAVFAATFINDVAGVVGGAVGVGLGAGLTSKMAENVETEEVAACSHGHDHKDDHAPNESGIRKKLRKLSPRYMAASATNLFADVAAWRRGEIDPERKRTLRRKFTAMAIGGIAMGATAYLSHRAGASPDAVLQDMSVPDLPSGDVDIPDMPPEQPAPEQEMIPQDIHAQVGTWDGSYDAQTGLYEGTVSDTVAGVAGVTREQLEQNPELAREFYALEGDVLSGNGLTRASATSVQPAQNISVSGERLQEFWEGARLTSSDREMVEAA